MRAYISGPVTGTSDYRERFMEAQENILYSGLEVVNPVAISELLPELSHREYMAVDLALLNLCDAVYFLKGWESSEGCRQERRVAMYLGLHLMYEED